jgi:uncharacterized C2H2 Zn-finger protein
MISILFIIVGILSIIDIVAFFAIRKARESQKDRLAIIENTLDLLDNQINGSIVECETCGCLIKAKESNVYKREVGKLHSYKGGRAQYTVSPVFRCKTHMPKTKRDNK